MNRWNLRPARDHGLTPQQRLRSSGRESGLGGLILGFIWRGFIRTLLQVVYRLKVTGREHLPAPPFVIVANHSSHLDALTITAALPRKLAHRAFALAAADTFFTSLPGSAFSAYAINALPVSRKGATHADVDLWRARLLEDGRVLILFPEGTRSRTGALGQFRPGIGILVAGDSIPVIPCFIAGAFDAWPATRRLPRPGRLRLIIGPALHFGHVFPDRAGKVATTEACEAAVRCLAVLPQP